MNKLLRPCLVLLGALVALTGLALPATASTPVHLSGTVTNTDGVPQQGFVYLQRIGSNQAGGFPIVDGVVAGDWNPDTNPEGDYLIYVRSQTMDGMERYYVAGNVAGTTQKDLATVVHLGPGAADVSFTMVLPAIARATGRIVGTDGAGLSGISVSIGHDGHSRSAVSGAGGVIDFGYLQAATWKIVAGGSGFLPAQLEVVVPVSGSVTFPDVVLRKAGSLSGRVTDSVTGDPIAFVSVIAYDAGTHTQVGSPATTDVNGSYQVTGLGTAPVVVGFYDSADAVHGYPASLNDGGDPTDWTPQTPITLAEGEQRHLDQELVLQPAPSPPAHTLTGTVTDAAGTPLVAIDVTAGELETTTDRRGHWYLDAPTGTHHLTFAAHWRWGQIFGNAPGWFPATATATTGGPASSTTMVRAGRISGSLVTSGATVGGYHLWAYDAQGALVTERVEEGNDSYSLEVPAGVAIRLLARGHTDDDPAVALLPRWVGDVDSRAAATPVQAGAGEVVNLDDLALPSTLTSLTAPVVTGTRAVGRTLTATTGTWSTMTQTTFTRTWWRGSVQVGSGASYLVKPADAGSTLRVRVVASNGPVTAAPVLSAVVPVARLQPAITVRGSSPRAHTARLAVAVRAAGVVPSGTLVIRRGARIVARVRLVHGAAVLTLRRQPSGAQRYLVSYSGSPQVAARTAPAVRVRVR